MSPKNGLLVTGELKPKSRFLGNSAATIMEGEDRIRLLDRPEDGEYVITVSSGHPSLLSTPGSMATISPADAKHLRQRDLVWQDDARALRRIDNHQRHDAVPLRCGFQSKGTPVAFDVGAGFRADYSLVQGWISGGYNVIEGAVKGPGEVSLGTVSGHWSDVMEYTDKKTGKKRVLFNPHHSHVVPKNVLPESEQEEYESRRCARVWFLLHHTVLSPLTFASDCGQS